MERIHAEDRPSFEQALDRAMREGSRYRSLATFNKPAHGFGHARELFHRWSV
jgi:hypothetical protein